MNKALLEILIHLFTVLPFIYIFRNKGNERSKKLVLLFIFYFISNQLLLNLPLYFSSFQFINYYWNWSGKILAVVGSLIFYFYFKDWFQPYHFIRFRQEKASQRKVYIVMAIISIIAITEGILFYYKSWNLETLPFQLTLPGIDEEIAYRGIMLGILSSVMSEKIKIFKVEITHPSIWINGLLFGMIHALRLNPEWKLKFNVFNKNIYSGINLGMDGH